MKEYEPSDLMVLAASTSSEQELIWCGVLLWQYDEWFAKMIERVALVSNPFLYAVDMWIRDPVEKFNYKTTVEILDQVVWRK